MVHFELRSFRDTHWNEYALRFLFGGAITAATGLIAKHWGPGVGGLFLAFPALLPASSTLLESRIAEERRKAGLVGRKRALQVAGVDAFGAAMGCGALFVFALIVWREFREHNPWIVLALSSMAWFAIAVTTWKLRKMRHRLLHRPGRV